MFNRDGEHCQAQRAARATKPQRLLRDSKQTGSRQCSCTATMKPGHQQHNDRACLAHCTKRPEACSSHIHSGACPHNHPQHQPAASTRSTAAAASQAGLACPCATPTSHGAYILSGNICLLHRSHPQPCRLQRWLGRTAAPAMQSRSHLHPRLDTSAECAAAQSNLHVAASSCCACAHTQEPSSSHAAKVSSSCRAVGLSRGSFCRHSATSCLAS